MSEKQAEATVLDVRGLQTVFFTNSGLFKAVDDVSFQVRRGETLAIVGESGCGKSVTALSIMRLVPDPPGRIVGGSITLEGQDLLALDESEMREDPRRSHLDDLPGADDLAQPGDADRRPDRRGGSAAPADDGQGGLAAGGRRCCGWCGFPSPSGGRSEYPHQLSGGMRQRAMIAMALACRPALLIADEPTTALDVTIQAQILALMLDLQKELGMGLILITHDLGVVAQTAQRVIVMYAGRKVEEADVETLFANPRHPYTRGLMASIPARAIVGRQRGSTAGRDSRHGALADPAAEGLRLRAALRAGGGALPCGISAAARTGAPAIWRRAGARPNWRGAL